MTTDIDIHKIIFICTAPAEDVDEEYAGWGNGEIPEAIRRNVIVADEFLFDSLNGIDEGATVVIEPGDISELVASTLHRRGISVLRSRFAKPLFHVLADSELDELAEALADFSCALPINDYSANPFRALFDARDHMGDDEPMARPLWGIDELDAMAPLAVPLSVILAPPGSAKTTGMLQACLATARAGIPALFVSLEMPAAHLQARVARLLTGGAIDEQAALEGRMRDELYKAAAVYPPLMGITNPADHSAEQLLETVRRAASSGVRLVCIDHLQAVKVDGTRHEQLGDLVAEIYDIAARSDLRVILASQVTREASRSNIVRLSDGASTAGIEHKADRVLAFTRDKDYADVIHVGCAKDRFSASRWEVDLQLSSAGLV